MSSLAMISRYKFVSGAEEKVIRAFEAPFNYVENFRRICGIKFDDNEEVIAPKGASVPSLGLSNKAVYSSNNVNDVKVNSKDPYPEESHFTAVELHGNDLQLFFYSEILIKCIFRATNRGNPFTEYVMARDTKTVWSWI